MTEELRSRSKVPDFIVKLLDGIPDGTHPMAQLSILSLALQV